MIEEKEYKKRREKLAKKLKPYSVTIVASATPKQRSNDTEYPYRQNSNFYYLTGFREDRSVLVFLKKAKKIKTILFVQEKDPHLELWSGKRLGVKEAKKHFLVDKVLPISKFQKFLQKKAQEASHLYYDFKESQNPYIQEVLKILKNISSKRDIAKKIEKMRLIKSKAEVKLIKKAIAITKKAHHHAMKIQKSGKFEYELQAEFEYIFKKNGAYSDAYTTIVAGGNNANTLHYIQNNQKLQSGDLVLIDAGCEYEYYASDITRTIPISGKFSKPQKELYELVLDVQKKIIKMIKPGVLRSDLQKKAQKLLAKGLQRLGVVSGSLKKIIKKDIARYYPHGIGHFMGLDVHDQNPYKEKGQEIPLQAGMVLTIEPGVYIPRDDTKAPKRYRGIGMRIEDNILVTKKGCKNLSKEIIKEVHDIEHYSS